MPTSLFTSQSTWFLVSFWFVPRCTHMWEIWNMSHGVWYMHIHFHRCFIFGWQIVIIQFSLLNYGLPLTYLVKRLHTGFRSLSSCVWLVHSRMLRIQVWFFCSRGGEMLMRHGQVPMRFFIFGTITRRIPRWRKWVKTKEDSLFRITGALITGPDLCNSSSG